jgi:urease beta subunit
MRGRAALSITSHHHLFSTNEAMKYIRVLRILRDMKYLATGKNNIEPPETILTKQNARVL